MLSIEEIANKYQVDQKKDHYPLNTIRVLYLILIETLSANKEEIATKMVQVIPLVRELLDKRIEIRLSGQIKNLNQELEAVEPILQSIETILGTTTKLRSTIEQLFACTLPIQENILFGIVSKAKSQEKIFSANDVNTTLCMRSVDSVIYSQILCDLIDIKEHNLSIHSLVNLTYQINDLIDSIVYAKEDTEGQNFSAFEVMRKAVPDSSAAKDLIRTTLKDMLATTDSINFPEETKKLVKEFLEELISVLGEGFLGESTQESQNSPAEDLE